eukprot:CAMPEP_0172070670 /NCGR_PEP_ID=MMETSP1043-20130122/13386_1 /TAXON_ID=464988 /ORGANISM="Hemiselmis andersenii, Strain CCMP441" /LENGTH=317 /DNA_ID=CAMNT_0012731047 /DNA_START=124 /DNA_END=1073 /DNA_ORIENTATION=-
MFPPTSTSGKNSNSLASDLGTQGRNHPPFEAERGRRTDEMKVEVLQVGVDGQEEGEEVKFWQVHRWQRASKLKLLVFIVALAGIITVFAVLPTYEYLEAYAEWSEDKIAAGVFALAGLYIVLTVLLFPCSLLTILAGLLFGLPIAIPTVVIAATIGSTVAFVLGRYLLQEWVKKMAGRYKVMSAVYQVMSRNGFKVSILLRLSPVIPFNALNYALSLTEISLIHYVVSTFFGIIPGTVLFCFIGSTAQSISEATSGDYIDSEGGAGRAILFFVGLALTILVTIGISWFARRELKKEMALEGPPTTPTDSPHPAATGP